MHTTIQEDIAHRVRLYPGTDPVIYDAGVMEALYHDYGSMVRLADALEIPHGAVADILKMHGITVSNAGGKPDFDETEEVPVDPARDPLDLMREVGREYPARLVALMRIGLHSDWCFAKCPMFWGCWDIPLVAKRHKKRDCRLETHMRLTGVL